MSNSTTNPQKELVLSPPSFSLKDLESIQQYFTFNEQYYWEINNKLTAALESHPLWSRILQLTTTEQRKQQSMHLFELQRAAIFEGKWKDYSQSLMLQGIAYARMNIAYSDWYELIKQYKNYLLPYIQRDFANSAEKAIMVIDGFSKFTDYSMYGIAEAYSNEKNNSIKTNEERFRAIFENADAHIFLIDRYAVISMINHVAKGYIKEEILGKSIYDFQPPENIAVIKNAIDTVFEKSISSTYFTISNRNGEKKYYSSSVSPILDGTGTVNSAVVITRDITKQKVAEEEVLELNRTLEKKVADRTEELNSINKELEAFSYSVSHDLRSPLRAINGFTQILVEELAETTGEDVKEAMHSIITNAKKMGELIDNLLEFSRLGKQEIIKRDVDMNELLNQILMELGYKENDPLFTIKALGMLNGDRPMIKQVMINLITNAVKYSGKNGNPNIEIGSYKQNNQVVFYVKDNGVGFDMAYYDKLFGVFQRLHHAREFEGIGVGLAIVHRIITKHEGKIWADGKVNEGATFYFTIPDSKHIN